ncbi:MAG: glycosyl transferase, partial [Chitinophagaceae bacterium]|nr:glycosyl transferase [Chitinophagaceae bacterium]
MKKILYTVCSANHLAHCKTMCDSFAALHPDYTIIIGLVDKIEGRFSKDLLAPHSIWEINTLDIPHFDDITARYTVIELNCAMKAFMAQAIFAREYP